MNFERDKKGRYLINKAKIDESYLALPNVSGTLNHSSYAINFWLVDENGVRTLVKGFEDHDYLSSICGELLFSKFAEKNSIPCAKTDVGFLESKNAGVVLSRDVVPNRAENDCYELYDFAKQLGYDMMRPSNFNSVENDLRLIERAKNELDLDVDENLRFDFERLAMIGYLCGIEDCNESNILISVSSEGGGRGKIKLCPMIDNESAFCFSSEYISEAINRGLHLLPKENTFLKDFYSYVRDDNLIECLPALAIKSSLESYSVEDSLEKMVDNGINYKEIMVHERFLHELAEMVKANEKLYKFFLGLDSDFSKMAGEIESESGSKSQSSLWILQK